jgi:uncharacterized membrane protein
MVFNSFKYLYFIFFSFDLRICNHFFQVDNLDWKFDMIMIVSTIFGVFFFPFKKKVALSYFFVIGTLNPYNSIF